MQEASLQVSDDIGAVDFDLLCHRRKQSLIEMCGCTCQERRTSCTQGLAALRKDIMEIVMSHRKILEPGDVVPECALLASVLRQSTVLFNYQNPISRENIQ
jgi:hypothetical protein